MSILYLPVGPPGAGKSHLVLGMVTFGKLDPRAVICPDDLRAVCTGSRANQHENTTVFSVARRLVSARLRNNLDVWLDATNLRREWVQEYLTMAQNYNSTPVWVILDVDEALCRKRNEARGEPVPDEIMDKMFEYYRALDLTGLGRVVHSSDLLDR